MRIMVTGGAGFIASHICDRLIADGHRVSIIDNLSSGRLENVNPEAVFYEGDICSPIVGAIFKQERPEFVIHHAAQVSVPASLNHPIRDGNINVMGSLNLFDNCRQLGIKKIIYASSAAVYGEPCYLGIDELHPINPISFYGLSKYIAELYLQRYASLYDMKYTILRYANVYGPRQRSDGEGGVISIFVSDLLNDKAPIIYGQGEQSRDFVFVKDVVEANVQALCRAENELINIGTGQASSIINMYNLIKSHFNTAILPCFAGDREGDILHSFFNIAQAKNVLDWKAAFSLAEGLKATIDYYGVSQGTVL